MRFHHKPIVSLLVCAVVYTPQLSASDSSCNGQPNSEAISLAISDAIASARAEVFNPTLENQMADIGNSIALLDQQRAEIQNILAAGNPAAAADLWGQVAKTIANLGIDLCRIGCPSGGADVVLQMRDQVYASLDSHNGHINGAPPSSTSDAQKLTLNYPSKKVKKSAKSAHAFAKHISASIQLDQNESNDQALRDNLAKLDAQLSQLRSQLLSLNAKLAQLETENKGFPAILANITQKSFETGQVQFSCSESSTTGGVGGSSSSVSHSSAGSAGLSDPPATAALSGSSVSHSSAGSAGSSADATSTALVVGP